jgi:hypothetical protein
MSRTRHPRPAQTGDELSRVTQAAIGLADEVTRLNRARARLGRAVEGARTAGCSEEAVRRAVSMAALGRHDRRVALAAWPRIDEAINGGGDE